MTQEKRDNIISAKEVNVKIDRMENIHKHQYTVSEITEFMSNVLEGPLDDSLIIPMDINLPFSDNHRPFDGESAAGSYKQLELL